MKKYFCKNLVMSAEENEKPERTNICWICGKLILIKEGEIIVISLVNIEEMLIRVVISTYKLVKK